jgi:hypothetical protein
MDCGVKDDGRVNEELEDGRDGVCENGVGKTAGLNLKVGSC